MPKSKSLRPTTIPSDSTPLIGTVTSMLLSDLVPHPAQPLTFDVCSAADDLAFVQDLRGGQRDAIHVMPPGNAAGLPAFCILDGHRRATGLKKLGKKTALVIVRHDLIDADAKTVGRLFVNFNRNRRQLSEMALARLAIRELESEMELEPGGLARRHEKKAEQRVANVMGYSTKNARRYVLILTQTPLAVQRAVESGLLKVDLAPKVAWLSDESKAGLAEELSGVTDRRQAGAILAKYVETQRKHRRGNQPEAGLGRYLAGARAEIGDQAQHAHGGRAIAFLAEFRAAVTMLTALIDLAELALAERAKERQELREKAQQLPGHRGA